MDEYTPKTESDPSRQAEWEREEEQRAEALASGALYAALGYPEDL